MPLINVEMPVPLLGCGFCGSAFFEEADAASHGCLKGEPVQCYQVGDPVRAWVGNSWKPCAVESVSQPAQAKELVTRLGRHEISVRLAHTPHDWIVGVRQLPQKAVYASMMPTVTVPQAYLRPARFRRGILYDPTLMEPDARYWCEKCKKTVPGHDLGDPHEPSCPETGLGNCQFQFGPALAQRIKKAAEQDSAYWDHLTLDDLRRCFPHIL